MGRRGSPPCSNSESDSQDLPLKPMRLSLPFSLPLCNGRALVPFGIPSCSNSSAMRHVVALLDELPGFIFAFSLGLDPLHSHIRACKGALRRIAHTSSRSTPQFRAK